ncbi:hypothetical protein ENBRE01_0145 [Enteropsectra breve]|nr:hypothetical protein ENBRE01_0145 [Enteropsectra breve]
MTEPGIMDIFFKEFYSVLGHDEAMEIMKKENISVAEYNQNILRLIGRPHLVSHGKDGMPPNFHKNYKFLEKNENEARALLNSPEIHTAKILECFYRHDYAPSFLFHNKMLALEDYSYFLKIYGQIYGLNGGNDKNISYYLESLINTYTEELIEECNGDYSLETLRKIVEDK